MGHNGENFSCNIEAAKEIKGTHFYEKGFSEDQLSYTVQGKQEGVDFPPYETLSSVAVELAKRNPAIQLCDIMKVRENANKMGELGKGDIIRLNHLTLMPHITKYRGESNFSVEKNSEPFNDMPLADVRDHSNVQMRINKPDAKLIKGNI